MVVAVAAGGGVGLVVLDRLGGEDLAFPAVVEAVLSCDVGELAGG